MQCNFTFYRFVSSSLLFLEVVVKLFDYFWKPNSLFSKFCVNCLLMFYFVYCSNCALKDVNGAFIAYARWWHCACLKCVSGLRKLEKTLNFLRWIHVIDLVLKYCWDINERNWLQVLFYFIVLMGKVDSVVGMRFFHLCFRFWAEILSHSSVTETFAIGIQNWFDHDWNIFGVFC